MKYKLTILFTIFSLFAFSANKKLKACQEENKMLIDSIDKIVSSSDKDITIVIPSTNKQVQKTERAKEKYKYLTEKVHDKNKTKRNGFVNIRKTISQNSWALVIGFAIFVFGGLIGRYTNI